MRSRPRSHFTDQMHTTTIIMMLRVSQHGAEAKLEYHIQLRLLTEATGSPGDQGNEIKMTISQKVNKQRT